MPEEKMKQQYMKVKQYFGTIKCLQMSDKIGGNRTEFKFQLSHLLVCNLGKTIKFPNTPIKETEMSIPILFKIDFIRAIL